ncbi:MAG: hypothetical protein HFH93_02610 [Lachnospiraceae bacterium]|nr:hypothetical protein [Lachnospiraceae bacterium]
MTNDSVLTVIGDVAENEYVKMGGIEIIPKEIRVESIADALPTEASESAWTC